MNWSNSKLRLLRTCAHAFAEQYMRGTEPHPNPALEGGSAGHRGIAMIVGQILANLLIDIQSIVRHAVHGRSEEAADTLAVLTTFQESLADADELLIDPDHVILYEERISMPVTLEDGRVLEFNGQADLVEQYGKRVVITDWKTNWRPETQEAFGADPQLPRYALLVSRNVPNVTEFVLRKRFVRYHNSVRERTLTLDDLKMVEYDLIQEITWAEARVESASFPAYGGDWCSLCGYAEACPLVELFHEQGVDLAIDDDEKAAAIAAQMHALDAAAGQMKRKLKVYLGGDHPTGQVPVAGGVYGYGPSTKRSLAAEDVRDLYEAHGVALPWPVLRVHMDTLDRQLVMEPGALQNAVINAIHLDTIAVCRTRKTAPTSLAAAKKKAPPTGVPDVSLFDLLQDSVEQGSTS